jgi:hypothetical protein
VAGGWRGLYNEKLHNLYERGRACSMHGSDEKCITHFSENVKGRDHLEDLGVDGKY